MAFRALNTYTMLIQYNIVSLGSIVYSCRTIFAFLKFVSQFVAKHLTLVLIDKQVIGQLKLHIYLYEILLFRRVNYIVLTHGMIILLLNCIASKLRPTAYKTVFSTP